MSNNPQQPDGGRPMPPNYSQASGPQQPYAQTHRNGQPGGQPSAAQQYGSQPQYGSQQYGSPSSYGSPYPENNPGQQGQNFSGQPGGQQYCAQPGQPGYRGQPGPGFAQPVGSPALFNSQLLPDHAYGPGSEQFWMASEPERTTALWSHIGTIFFGFLPLIMFLVKKDESAFVREHTRQGLNALITNTIITTAAFFFFAIVGFVLALVTFGIGILIMYAALIVPMVYLVLYIIAGVAANRGEGYKFPLTFDFVK